MRHPIHHHRATMHSPIDVRSPREEHPHTREEVMRRIRADFAEMPDLRISEEQAARFWGIDVVAAKAGLTAMTESGFLKRIGRVYIRRRPK
jgi:hypothetical protein